MIVEYEFRLLGHRNYYKTVINTSYVPQVGTFVNTVQDGKQIKGTVKEITYYPDIDQVHVVVK